MTRSIAQIRTNGAGDSTSSTHPLVRRVGRLLVRAHGPLTWDDHGLCTTAEADEPSLHELS